MTRQPLQLLRQTFGYDDFRGSQREIIEEVISGRDALVLMPTGGGKSLCYQLPALVRAGVGIVISPLIALMQDQVAALAQLGVRAGYLNSTLERDAARRVEQALRAGQLDLLYVAPERLTQERTLTLLEHVTIALFAIDEAHCVSQWGHDFRADYLQLNLLQERFPHVPRIALTATADARTRAEIVERLALGNASHYISGFDRPNIQYRITHKRNSRQQLLQLLRHEHGRDAGIVYCRTRKSVGNVATWLQGQGFCALPYHAGLPAEVRQQHQQRFLREDGVIVVATIAFGLGIDKPDVRFVAHLDLPQSVESYYQETGRAGRDGQPATAWMAYGLQDVANMRQLLMGSSGFPEHVRVKLQKLDALLGLCEITTCRRHALLRYFGEHSPDHCGNCDTCLAPVETWDGTIAVQKALSCVYRTGQRFGVNHLIDVLRGKETEKVQQHGHQRIKTYGVGAELDDTQWRSVFRQLVARGYLQVDVAGYGALQVTARSRPLLRGEESISLRRDLPEKAAPRPRRERRERQLAAGDQALFEALRQCRLSIAQEQDVPAYVIFHDATLMDMASSRPLDAAQLLGINGVGRRKLERYGAAFLDVIREFDAAPAVAGPERSGQ